MSKPKIYLCGGMEAAPDLGLGIREAALPHLEAAGLEPAWPMDLCELRNVKGYDQARLREQWASAIALWREGKDSHPIFDDLRIVQECDGVLVLLDRYAGKGTRLEVEFALYLGLPVALVWLTVPEEDGVATAKRIPTLQKFVTVADACAWLKREIARKP